MARISPTQSRIDQLLWRCAIFAPYEVRLREVPHNCVVEEHACRRGAAGRATRRLPPAGGRHGTIALRGFLAALLLGCGLPCLALEPTTPLANYGRQSWGMENGLPQNTVQALAQTKNGFIWLGTEAGLVRFDGNSFAVFDKNSTPALPGNDVRCLLETRDGALWIGTSEGLARWKDGAVTAFSTNDGLPGNGIRGLVETRDGVLWVWTDGGLVRQNSERFMAITAVDGLATSAITSVASDGAGGSWVATTEGTAMYWNGRWIKFGPAYQAEFPKDGVEFVQTLPVAMGPVMSKMPPDQLAVASKSTLVLIGLGVLDHWYVGHELPGSRIQALFKDRVGSLWIGTNGGLARWVAGKVQRLPVTDPLATASILALMEDREGNLWVGTETGGLHILRDQRFRTMGAREGLSSNATTTVVEDAAGTLWVGTSGAGLNAVGKNGHVKSYTVKDGLLSDVILSLAAAPNGDLWVGTPDGLNRIRGGKIDAFTSADGLPDDFIRSLLADNSCLHHPLLEQIGPGMSHDQYGAILRLLSTHNEVMELERALLLLCTTGGMERAVRCADDEPRGGSPLSPRTGLEAWRLLKMPRTSLLRRWDEPWFCKVVRDGFLMSASRPGWKYRAYGSLLVKESWSCPHLKYLLRGMGRSGLLSRRRTARILARVRTAEGASVAMFDAMVSQQPELTQDDVEEVLHGARLAVSLARRLLDLGHDMLHGGFDPVAESGG